jgi:hypothetical protein
MMNNSNKPIVNSISKYIFVFFIISILFSFTVYLKFNKTNFTSAGHPYHEIIKGDSAHYFLKAEIFKKNIEENNAFFFTGEYQSSFLYPILLGAYYESINQDLFKKNKINGIKIINNNNLGFGFIILQTILYFYSIYYLSIKLREKIPVHILKYIIFFLSLEPTIFQFHGLFMTETLYLSFLNIFIAYSFSPKKSYIANFIFGFLIGLSYLIKTTSILLVIPFSIYLICIFKKESFLIIVNLIFGYLIVLFMLGLINYNRSGVFYFTPTQSMDAPYWYMSHIIDARSKNISNEEAYEIKILSEKKWINENIADPKTEKDNIAIARYKQKYSNEIFLNNISILTKYVAWKSFQFLIINPGHLYQYLKINYVEKDYWKLIKNKSLFLKISIGYSLIIYLIIFVGFLNSFKFFDKKFIILILGLMIYYLVLLGWTGGSRYNLPILCLSTMFFASAVGYIKNLIFSKFRK